MDPDIDLKGIRKTFDDDERDHAITFILKRSDFFIDTIDDAIVLKLRDLFSIDDTIPYNDYAQISNRNIDELISLLKMKKIDEV